MQKIHWPKAYVKQEPFNFFPTDEEGNEIMKQVPLSATWAAMEALVAAGKVKSIGVSNFSPELVEELLAT